MDYREVRDGRIYELIHARLSRWPCFYRLHQVAFWKRMFRALETCLCTADMIFGHDWLNEDKLCPHREMEIWVI